MSGWRKIPVPQLLLEEAPKMRAWQREVHDGHLSVFAGPEPDGFHLSISHRTSDGRSTPGRYPTWDEIHDARYRFCPLDMVMAMLLPPSGRVRERPLDDLPPLGDARPTHRDRRTTMTERLDLDLAPDRPSYLAEPRPGPPERQVWKRGLEEAHVHIDERGIVQASEAVVAQLLLDAGWERSA